METNYNNGHVIDVSKMTISEYEAAAKDWSEGSKCLEELLLYCLKNGIITQACCIGHKENDMAFLQFEFSDRNMKAITKIINRYYNLNGVNMTFVNQPEVISKFDIRVPKNIGEQFFKDMLSQLSNGLDIGIDSLTSDMQSTIAAMISHKVPNEYLEVQYSMNDNKKDLFVATTNPNYSESYWNKAETKSWVDGSIGIEGPPEKIEPIIKDISKKTSHEYSNYLERQSRLNKVVPSSITTIESKKDEPTMAKVTNAELKKNNAILNKPTMLETDADEGISPIVFNAAATRENDYARRSGITICEVLPGMNIDDVAQAMCGQRYICKFNNFEIDGMKYNSPEEIVFAYKKHWEEGKKRLLESRKKQEQIDCSTRQEQFASMANNQELNLNTELEEGGLKR